jgi:hypothetical protein
MVHKSIALLWENAMAPEITVTTKRRLYRKPELQRIAAREVVLDLIEQAERDEYLATHLTRTITNGTRNIARTDVLQVPALALLLPEMRFAHRAPLADPA